jgi:hypothetical protein
MRTPLLIGLAILAGCGSARCDDPFADELLRYFERMDRITVQSGDARNVNAVTHMIDPWPRYVHNRHIPGIGRRAVGAVDRFYNRVPTPSAGGSMGAGGGAQGGGGPTGGGNGGGQ